MKNRPILKVMISLCSLALGACSIPSETEKLPVSSARRPDASLVSQILQEVNTYRRNHGAADLQMHAGLNGLAQRHCEYLAQNRGKFGLYGKNVSHFGYEGRALAARERYKMINYCENVAAAVQPGKLAAPTLVKLWASSKDHEFNMRSDWAYTGIGVVVAEDGMVFSTEIFATASNSQLTNRQRFSGF
jgi:uncharacterized protein YkwD